MLCPNGPEHLVFGARGFEQHLQPFEHDLHLELLARLARDLGMASSYRIDIALPLLCPSWPGLMV